MNKKALITVIAALVVIGLAVWYLQTHPTRVTTTEVVTSTATSTKGVTMEIKSLDFASSSMKVHVEYPQFSDKPDLNDQIEREAKARFETDVTDVQGNYDELTKFGLDMSGRELVADNNVDMDFVYINDANEIASIGFTNYVDSGGAHGSFFFSSKVYDLKTGKTLALTDFLTGDYKAPLTAYIKEQVAHPTKDCVNCENLDGQVDDYLEKTPEGMIPKTFALRKDGIVFLFGAYELGPYVSTAGGQEILIPKDKLASFIKRAW